MRTYQARLAHLRSFGLPICKPTAYSASNENGESTRLDPNTVTDRGIPREYRVLRNDTSPDLGLVRTALERFLTSPQFPDQLFRPDGPLTHSRQRAQADADLFAPSGEAGVSHLLKTAMFDILNDILGASFPDETRYWQVIGIGKSGKTDWALFVNGVMVAIVELKPHAVSIPPFSLPLSPSNPWIPPAHPAGPAVDFRAPSTRKNVRFPSSVSSPSTISRGVELDDAQIFSSADMTAALSYVLDSVRTSGRCGVTSSWPGSGNKSKVVLYQMWAQFSNQTACQSVKYAVILNESYHQQDPTGEDLVRFYSTALFLARGPDHLAIASSPITDATLLPGVDLPVLPFELLLGLSLLDVDAYIPPTITPNAPVVPSLPLTVTPRRITQGSTRTQPPASPSGSAMRPGRMLRSSGPVGDDPTALRQQHSLSNDENTADRHPWTIVKSNGETESSNDGSASQVLETIELEDADPDESMGSINGIESSSDESRPHQSHSSESSISAPPTTPLALEIDLGSKEIPQAVRIEASSGSGSIKIRAIEVQSIRCAGPLRWEPYRHMLNLPKLVNPQGGSAVNVGEEEEWSIDRLVGQGAIWSTYTSSRPTDATVYKISIPQTHPSSDVADADEYSCLDVQNAIKSELDILTGPLVKVYGTVVPALRGIYAGLIHHRMPVWVVAMQYGGQVVVLHDLLPHDKHEIVQLYRTLHRSGVLHGDCRTRNWLRRPREPSQPYASDRFFLIDFGRAKTREQAGSEGRDWGDLCRIEMEDVNSRLGTSFA